MIKERGNVKGAAKMNEGKMFDEKEMVIKKIRCGAS